MGKIAKRILIVICALIVVFGIGSFAYDRVTLDKMFARSSANSYAFMPTYEDLAEGHPRTPTEFQMNGATLRGYVYETSNPKGLVVFRHGIGANHITYLPMICALVDRGWNVFAYDALGAGESDGDSLLGMPQSALDVTAAVNHVRSSGIARDLPVVLWGHSWGGYGVAAAMDLVDVNGCVTMSGFNEPCGVIFEWAERMAGPLAVTQRPTLWLNNKLAFGADADRSALDGINRTDTPVLIIHGTGDTTVAYDGSSIIAQRARIKNPNVSYLEPDEPGRNAHNSFFYTAEANAYLAQMRTRLNELQSDYPDGIPEEQLQAFYADYDLAQGNEPDPVLMDTIDKFLTEAIGGTTMQSATPGTAGNEDERAFGPLQAVRYSNSGNSLGNVYSLETNRADDGTLVVVESEKAQWSDPLTVREYRAPQDLLDSVSAIVDAAGAQAWDDLPPSEFFPLDASTPTVSLTYQAADPEDTFPIWVSFSSNDELPDNGETLWAIRDALEGCATDANLISEHTENDR